MNTETSSKKFEKFTSYFTSVYSTIMSEAQDNRQIADLETKTEQNLTDNENKIANGNSPSAQQQIDNQVHQDQKSENSEQMADKGDHEGSSRNEETKKNEDKADEAVVAENEARTEASQKQQQHDQNQQELDEQQSNTNQLIQALDGLINKIDTEYEGNVGEQQAREKTASKGASIMPTSETQEVSSTRNDEPPRTARSSRRPSYNSGRAYAGGYQNYGLTYLPYKSNFEPSEEARRRADEFLKTLKL